MKTTRQPQPGHGLPPPAPLYKTGDRVMTPHGPATIEIRSGAGWVRGGYALSGGALGDTPLSGYVFHVTLDTPYAPQPEMPWNTDTEAMFYEVEMSLIGEPCSTPDNEVQVGLHIV